MQNMCFFDLYAMGTVKSAVKMVACHKCERIRSAWRRRRRRRRAVFFH